MTTRHKRIFLFLFSLSLFLAMACASSARLPEPTATSSTPSSRLEPIDPQSPAVVVDYIDQQDRLTAIYERVNPGVVAIRVLSDSGDGQGSGFVIDLQGHIVTNYHVVQSATDLEIIFSSGYRTRGTILGTDTDSDIAVIKVEAPAEELHPIPLGDSSLVKVGQLVAAIGNPHGLDGSMTIGIVSSKGRTMSSLHEAPGGSYYTAGDIIQTDAAINPGNSGGPLLNLDGEVIGVNVAIESTTFDVAGQPVNSGIGFAISINIVKRVVPALIAEGFYDYPYLGISSLNEITLFQQEGLGLERSTGVYVLTVTPGSPAEIAGVRAASEPSNVPGLLGGGDLIIAVDDQEVRDFGDLISYLLNHKAPGDVITLTVLRGGETIDLELTLAKRP